MANGEDNDKQVDFNTNGLTGMPQISMSQIPLKYIIKSTRIELLKKKLFQTFDRAVT